MPEVRPCRYIDRDEDLQSFVASLAGLSAIALDTESNSFYAYNERVCLIQVSTEAEDVAIDPFRVDVRPLGAVLADARVEIVAHAADYDIRCLKRDFGFCIGRLFDTMLASRLLGRREVGLAALVRQHFGVELAKVHQRSDWGRRPLSTEQIAYAFTDTRYLLALKQVLVAELQTAGKTEQARDAFARQAACEPRPRRFNAEGYRQIRGWRALDPGARMVARALYLLREDLARSWDRPPFKIYGDEVILEIARRHPHGIDELGHIKGLGESTIRRGGTAILGAIASAGTPGVTAA